MRPVPSSFETRGRRGSSGWGKILSSGHMTITSSIDGTRGKIDWTRPVLWLVAAGLVVLILLPLSWLAVYSVTDKAHHVTLQDFITLFTHPDFLHPLLTTAINATTSATLFCLVAATIGLL